MKKNYWTLFTLLILVHLMPILQGCPWSCPDIRKLLAKTSHVEFRPNSYDQKTRNNNFEAPFDRNTLQILMNLETVDSLQWYVHDISLGFTSSAFAREECEDFYVVIAEHIEAISIWDLNGEMKVPRTDEFLVGGSYGDLYQEIDDYLEGSFTQAWLIAKYQPEGDTVNYLIETTLSDGRLFSDTLNIGLK